MRPNQEIGVRAKAYLPIVALARTGKQVPFEKHPHGALKLEISYFIKTPPPQLIAIDGKLTTLNRELRINNHSEHGAVMTTVDLNRLKGNYAEHLVASWLGRSCLVRPVAEGTDIGVDLFCESVIEGNPFLHFWAQVKAINQKHISVDGNTAWFDFETKHLRYWQRQPVPVYAFLVPLDQWPPSPPIRVYGLRLTRQMARLGIPDQETMRLETTERLNADAIDSGVQQFITEVVPADSSMLFVSRGIIAPVPSVPGQINAPKWLLWESLQYIPKILESIRDTAMVVGVDLLFAEKKNPDWKYVRQRFEAIAALFENEQPYTGTWFLAISALRDGDRQRATNYVLKACNRIESDPSLDSASKGVKINQLKNLLTGDVP